MATTESGETLTPPASRQDWREVMALLDIALELAPESRTAWVGALPPPQARLAPLLRELLASHASDAASDFMRAPAAFDADDAAAAGLAPGVRVGPYRLEREIGRGGMATVWLAARVDGSMERRVALKIPLQFGPRGVLSARFARERDILARLAHAHIARLYDAGVSDDGTPYLALEHVEGDTMLAYCDARRLGIDARLALFEQVLGAVQHAHASLVIHRDLKPANILVTAQGEVRLLDFGIAQLLSGDQSLPDSAVTRFAGRPLTPDYASPEQIRGEPLTIATDIYSLGVVLHELLCGRPPYRLRVRSSAMLEAAVLDAEAQRPSEGLDADAAAARGTSLRRGARRLAGDLDTIVAKAMRKDRSARYASAAAFADDIRRHRDGVSVLARPDAWTYRTGKFLRRRRYEVAAAVVAVAGLSAATVVALVQAGQAMVEARKAEAVKAFLLEMLTSGEPGTPQGRAAAAVTVDEMLDRAADRAVNAFDAQPEVKAELLRTLGRAYETLALQEKSVAMFDAALAVPDAGDAPALKQRAALLVQKANALTRFNRFTASSAALDSADLLFARLGDTDSLTYAQALGLRGANQFRRRDAAAALAPAAVLLTRSAALYRSRFPGANGHLDLLWYLADAQRELGERAASLATADEAVALAEAAGTTNRLPLAHAHAGRAYLRVAAGDGPGAVEDFSSASVLYEKMLGADHPMTLTNRLHHGRALVNVGRPDLGMPIVVSIQQRVRRSKPGSLWDAAATALLAGVWIDRGRPDEAEPLLLEARASYAAPIPGMSELGQTGSWATLMLGSLRAGQGRYEEAEALLGDALRMRSTGDPRDTMPQAEARLRLGLLALHRGDHVEAATQLNTALDATDPRLTRGASIRARAEAGLARLALATGAAEPAMQVARAARQTLDSAPDLQQDAATRAVVLDTQGRVTCRFGDRAEGGRLLAQAEALQVARVSPVDLGLASTRIALGACLADARPLDAAAAALASHREVEPYLRQALEVARLAR